MNAVKKSLLITCLTVFVLENANRVAAQQGVLKMTISASVAAPQGQFKDYADKTTLRGANVSFIYGINSRFGAGLDAGFQDFYKKFPRAMYKLEDGSDLSAVISNSVQAIPLLAILKYALTAKGIQPYLSAAAGGAIIINREYVGEFVNEFNKFTWAIRPALGVYIPFKKEGEVGLNLSGYYNYAGYKGNGLTNLSYAGITIGVGFPARN
jgi:hypothetical protein